MARVFFLLFFFYRFFQFVIVATIYSMMDKQYMNVITVYSFRTIILEYFVCEFFLVDSPDLQIQFLKINKHVFF